MAGPGFYRKLGLTKAEFYVKLKGRAGGARSATDKEILPYQSKPRTTESHESLPQTVDEGLTRPANYGKMVHKNKSPQTHRKCNRTKAGDFCGVCYEKAKGRS